MKLSLDGPPGCTGACAASRGPRARAGELRRLRARGGRAAPGGRREHRPLRGHRAVGEVFAEVARIEGVDSHTLSLVRG